MIEQTCQICDMRAGAYTAHGVFACEICRNLIKEIQQARLQGVPDSMLISLAERAWQRIIREDELPQVDIPASVARIHQLLDMEATS